MKLLLFRVVGDAALNTNNGSKTAVKLAQRFPLVNLVNSYYGKRKEEIT